MTDDDPPETRFARLIQGLKRRTRLPQLDGFSIANGRTVLFVDNQKITFGERVTVEFIPRKGSGRPSSMGQVPSSPPSPPRTPGTPEEPPPSPRQAKAPPPKPARTAEQTPPPAEGDDGYDPSVERFRRLDLD